MIDYEQTLIESTRTHRVRLAAAFVHGAQDDRRPVNTNVRRFTGSVVLAAVVCAGCLGTSFVLDILQTQRENTAISAYQQAIAANPIEPGDGLVEDEPTGYLRNEATGELIDPKTGFVVDPETGLATDPEGRTVDPRTGWFVDVETGYFTDPASGLTINPETLKVVDPTQEERGR